MHRRVHEHGAETRPDHQRVRLASVARVVALLIASWLSACGGKHHREERLPLPTTNLPLLSCAELPDVRGDCRADADCGEGQRCALVAPLGDRDPLELQCAAAQGTGSDRDRCERGSDCETGLCALAGVCVAACDDDGDCETGERCQRVEVRLAAGLTPARACSRSVAFPADVKVSEARANALSTSKTELLTPGVDSAELLYVKAERCDASLVIDALKTRGTGSVLFELDAALAGKVAKNPVVNNGPLVPVLVPNNPAVTPSTAGYALTLQSSVATDTKLVVASRAHRGDTLDLNVFYVGGGSNLASGGLRPASPVLGNIVRDFAARLTDLGLELGEVREHDVTGMLRDEMGSIEIQADSAPDLDRLFELSAGVDDTGINVFLVRDITLEPDGIDVLGISSGIPGGLGVHGTPLSGIALSLDLVSPARAALVLTHEMGHQMGLFHTSESDGFVIEPLADTPACTVDGDANGDGLLSPTECSELGADNLMFWAGSGGAVSKEQAQIMQRSLVLR